MKEESKGRKRRKEVTEEKVSMVSKEVKKEMKEGRE